MPYADKEKAREYNKQYHIKTWLNRKSKHLEWKRERRVKLAFWLKEYKQNLSCVRCNEKHPACLDFHHLNGREKDASVSNMISQGFSMETIIKEIGKCIVLCRNCHAKEHYK
jgi:dsDNA-binding SOS-regulon protein